MGDGSQGVVEAKLKRLRLVSPVPLVFLLCLDTSLATKEELAANRRKQLTEQLNEVDHVLRRTTS
ncbi:hypothetical protein ACWDWS_37895 [Streptomyces sp. NPDC003328]